jgi:excisionase family DNA binding protein
MKQEQLLSVAQVAEYLNVDKFTIYRLVTDGQIPAFKIGNQWRFKKKLIEQWLRDNSNTSTYRKKSSRRKR